MARADMHVHSKFSAAPSEWFLKQIGASESYTEPEAIYRSAKNRGMDYVTITDHNAIEGVMRLKDAHPDDVFTGAELTATFPDDLCQVHILVYGFSPDQFKEMNTLRRNIYDLRTYLRASALTHSVAHATYPVSRLLSCAHLERLLLLFDTFEGLNASRNRFNNQGWNEILVSLGPVRIAELHEQHGIEPFSSDAWIKGLTGGSDDHAGIFIAKGYTSASAETPLEFLTEIREKRSFADGIQNSYRELATAIYKVSYDYSRHRKKRKGFSMLTTLSEGLFEQKGSWLHNRLARHRLRTRYQHRLFSSDLIDLLETLSRPGTSTVDEKLPILYKKLTSISDGFIKELLASLTRQENAADLWRIVSTLYASVPGVILSLPFVSSLKHMFENRDLITSVRKKFADTGNNRQRRTLWFTDTFDDLNGVSVTIQNMLFHAAKYGLDVRAVVCLPDEKVPVELRDKVINLTSIGECTPSFYPTYTLRVPSVLGSIERIYQHEPDQIIISTPGPIGLLGLLLSRLLNLPAKAIYHTDFTAQAQKIMGATFVNDAIEWYTRWFYGKAEAIKVPTSAYIDILADRKFPRDRMTIFRRGIDSKRYRYDPSSRGVIQKTFKLREGITLLYAGRVSQDKSIDFLGDVYKQALAKYADLNLVIAGYGPYLDEFKKAMADYPGVVFTGRLAPALMPRLYAGSDVLVFPSTTDTFGMVVLEAQSCGLPAIVSDVGGPQEIVVNHKTGYVVHAHALEEWVNAVLRMIGMIRLNPETFMEMRFASQALAEKRHGWRAALDDIFGESPRHGGEERAPDDAARQLSASFAD